MSDTFQRSIIFGTFFLTLLCGSLVCTSLATNHWIESKLWRKPNHTEGTGRIYFGLLRGKKEVNFGIGLRTYALIVSEMIEENPELMSWSLYCTTLVSTLIALICIALTALLAVVNSVTTPQIFLFSIPGIYLTNALAFSMCFISTCTWLVQYYTRLYDNVLPQEDLDHSWTSKGASTLGFSFWLVIVAGILHIISVSLIKWSTIQTKKKQQKPFDPVEEKSVGAIMLY